MLAYSNTLESPFVMDDYASIPNNPAMQVWRYFAHPSQFEEVRRGELGHTFRTRIVGYFSFALNYWISGVDPMGYHITNICIHIISALLLYRLVLLMFRSPAMERSEPEAARWTAFCTAALFVAHPVQTQAVTYIVQRFASMSTMFYLACVVCYVQWRLGGGTKRAARAYAVSSFVFALLAVHTKETAFTIPFALALYEFVFIPGQWKEKARPLAPFFMVLLMVPWILMRKGQGVSGEVSVVRLVAHNMPHYVYALTELRVVSTYIRLLFLPIGQNLDYDYALSYSFFEPAVLVAFVLHSGLLSLASYLLYRQRNASSPWGHLCAFGILWFYLTLFIESGAVPIADVIMEHRVYLPSVGAMLVFACGFSMLRARDKVAGTLVFALVVGLLVAATYARNSVWATEVDIWKDAASKSPNKVRTNMSLITVYTKAKARNSQEASNVDIVGIYYSLGMNYYRNGKYVDAQAMLREVTIRDPLNVEAFYHLGNAFAQAGMHYDAIVNYEAALKLDPLDARIHSDLGSAFVAIGKRDDAVREFRKALRINPKYEKARTNLEAALSLK